MFNVVLSGDKKVNFRFYHLQRWIFELQQDARRIVAQMEGKKFKRQSWPYKGKQAVTVCVVSEVTPTGQEEPNYNRKTLCQAIAECGKKDLFIKRRGRTIALGRAIKELGLDNTEARLVWDSYEDAIDSAIIRSYRNLFTVEE